MKVRISATIDEKTDRKIDEFLKNNRQFRNKSHVIENAIEEYIEKEVKK